MQFHGPVLVEDKKVEGASLLENDLLCLYHAQFLAKV